MDKPMEYIDRTALIERIKTIYCAGCNNYNEVRCRACLISDALDCIADAPAVDVAPLVHGHWCGWGKSGTPTYENYGTCSVCSEDAEIYTEHRNHCPNCGAKMDEEEKHDPKG